MSLYCPQGVRVIDDEEWTAHVKAVATYDKLRSEGWKFSQGSFRTHEAERLRGLSA